MNEILEILPDYTPDYVIDEVKYYFDKIRGIMLKCET